MKLYFRDKENELIRETPGKQVIYHCAKYYYNNNYGIYLHLLLSGWERHLLVFIHEISIMLVSHCQAAEETNGWGGAFRGLGKRLTDAVVLIINTMNSCRYKAVIALSFFAFLLLRNCWRCWHKTERLIMFPTCQSIGPLLLGPAVVISMKDWWGSSGRYKAKCLVY